LPLCEYDSPFPLAKKPRVDLPVSNSIIGLLALSAPTFFDPLVLIDVFPPIRTVGRLTPKGSSAHFPRVRASFFPFFHSFLLGLDLFVHQPREKAGKLLKSDSFSFSLRVII